jgi:hypothetical protein
LMACVASGPVCRTRWLVVCALALWCCSARVSAQDETGPAARAPTVRMLLRAGEGVTQRIISMPSEQGTIHLTTGLAPTIDVRASARLDFEHWFVRFRAGYQSSLGLHADDRLRLAVAGQASSAVRSHRFEGGVAPGLWLGAGPGSAAISAYIAYGLRAFSSVAPLVLPRFTLHGPLVRVEFELPLIMRRLWLHLAPEAQLLTSYSGDLSRISHVYGPGLAFGGEAGFVLYLLPSVAVRLSYRESHAHLAANSLESAGFEDIERYFLAGVLVSY